MSAPMLLTPVAQALATLPVPTLLEMRDQLRERIKVLEVELAQVNEALERRLPSADEVKGILASSAVSRPAHTESE